MAIKIGSLERVNLEVAALVYQQLEVANLAYVKLEVGTLSRLNPEFTNVYLDPDSKNKVLHEIAAVTEQYFSHITLAKHDTVTTPDNYALALNKAVGEIIGVIEASVLDIRKALLDSSVVTDIYRIALHKIFTDNAFLSDVFDVHTIKAINDSVATSDLFGIVIEYVRYFQDYVALDDFAGIDKFYTGTKQNFVGAVDQAAFALSVLKHDTTSATDILNYVNTNKAFHDTMGFADALRKVSVHVLVDAPLVSDVSNMVLLKQFADSNTATDHSVLSSALSKADVVTMMSELRKDLLNKYSDATSATDEMIKGMHKVFHDTVAMDDMFDFMGQVAVTKNNVMSVSDVLVFLSSKDFADVALVNDVLSKTVTHPMVDSSSVSDVVALLVRNYLSDSISGMVDHTILASSLKKSDAVNMLTALRKSITTTLADAAITVEMHRKDIAKFFSDAVAVDDAFDFLDQAVIHNGNVTIVSDLLNIQSSKGATDVAIVSDAINVSYIPGNLMLFNNIQFNESTFG